MGAGCLISAPDTAGDGTFATAGVGGGAAGSPFGFRILDIENELDLQIIIIEQLERYLDELEGLRDEENDERGDSVLDSLPESAASSFTFRMSFRFACDGEESDGTVPIVARLNE